MRTQKFIIISLLLVLITGAYGQQKQRFTVLPSRAAQGIVNTGTWNLTKADLQGLEGNLTQISALKAEGWSSVVHIDHPEQYFRQYVGITRAGKKRIYINAFCGVQPPPYWHDRLVVVMDGATCYWQALYDPAMKKFSNLRINSRG